MGAIFTTICLTMKQDTRADYTTNTSVISCSILHGYCRVCSAVLPRITLGAHGNAVSVHSPALSRGLRAG